MQPTTINQQQQRSEGESNLYLCEHFESTTFVHFAEGNFQMINDHLTTYNRLSQFTTTTTAKTTKMKIFGNAHK